MNNIDNFIKQLKIFGYTSVVLLVCLAIIYYLVIWKIDSNTDYYKKGVKARVDDKGYIIFSYLIFQRRKKEYILSLGPRILFGEYVIVGDRLDIKGIRLFEKRCKFKVITKFEFETQRPVEIIQQDFRNNKGIVNNYPFVGVITENEVNNYGNTIKTSDLSAEDKKFLIDTLYFLQDKKPISKERAKRCISIMTAANALFSFSKNLIEIFTKFI